MLHKVLEMFTASSDARFHSFPQDQRNPVKGFWSLPLTRKWFIRRDAVDLYDTAE
jgi:hypothetical protein